MKHVVHSIAPVYDQRSRVLVLGSLPSPVSRAAGFYYGHPQNRFWRVMARLADEPLPTTNERKRDFCLRHHIALWDVVAACDIRGASDTSIRNARPNDLARILGEAPIEAVFCTGAKAHELYRRLGCEDACQMPARQLPSTSPANATYSLEALCAAYTQVFGHTHPWEAPVLSPQQFAGLGQALERAGVPPAELMARGGEAVAYRVQQVLADIAAGVYADRVPRLDTDGLEPLVVVLCGKGNNGGVGWAAAEVLAKADVPVCIAALKHPRALSTQPAKAVATRVFLQVETLVEPDYEELAKLMARATVVVDALFGRGLRGGITSGPYNSWVRLVNNYCGHHVTVAVDIPSGVNPKWGYGFLQSTPRVIADETLALLAPMPGLTARECGTVRVAPLAYLEPLLESASDPDAEPAEPA